MAFTIRLLVLILLLSSGIFSYAAPPPPSSGIRVVMDNNYPPYAFQDSNGKLQGVLVDQWHLWSKKTGIHAEIVGLNWAEAQRRMQDGEFDVIDTIFRNSTREQIYDFTAPYATVDINLFFHQDISGIRRTQDVKGFVVGVKTGGAVIEVLREQGVENVMQYETDEKLVQAARDGQIKVFALGHQSAAYFLNKYRIADHFRVTAEPVFTGKFHRAVKKGNTALLQTVEKGFAAISQEENRIIEKRWYGSGVGDRFPFRSLGYAAACVAGVFIVLLTWNRALNRAVKLRTTERENRRRLRKGQRRSLPHGQPRG